MAGLSDVEEWYFRAMSQSPDTRVAYLESHLTENEALLQQVLKLIQTDPDDDLLENFRNQLQVQESELAPELDRYKIVEELGRGGMAVVYRARRNDDTFDHDVALKVVKRGMDTDAILRRFRMERNLLASLQHENISHIYDGGVTKDGRPFFVMELVEGSTLLQLCKSEDLAINERLHLFLKVCGAVQYAHQNLVIHRDIKDSNIRINIRGELKLMDFGIAKVYDAENEQETKTSERFFTPAAASPEQQNKQKVDTRSDIYQLGLLLQQLTENQRISDDLQTVIEYATRKDPDRRYQDINQLVSDIQNVMNRRPIIARKENVGYRLRLFLIRNKVSTSVGMAAFLILVLSTVFYIVNLNAAQRQTEKEKTKALLVSNFLLGMFESIDPSYTRGDTITVQHVIDNNLHRLDQLDAEPELLAELYFIMSEISRKVGDNESRAQSLKKVLSLSDAKSEMYFDALIEASKANGFNSSADSLVNTSVEIASLSGDQSKYFEALVNKASHEFKTYQNFAAADSLFTMADSIHREYRVESSLDLIDYYTELGLFQWYKNELDSAAQLLRQVVKWRSEIDQNDLEINSVNNNLAGILYANGQVDESIEIYEKLLDEETEVYGRYSVVLITSLNNLLKCYNYKENSRKGRTTIFHLDSIINKYDSIAFYKAASFYIEKAKFYSIGNKVDSAIHFANESIELYRSMGDKHYMVAQTRADRGDIYMEHGMLDLAKDEYQFAFNIIDDQFGKMYSDVYKQKLETIDSLKVMN